MNKKLNPNHDELRESLREIEPKPEDFKTEEEYLEARDYFRSRAGHLLRPRKALP